MIQAIGTCTLKPEIPHTTYFFGEKHEIAGKTLKLLERNEEGACLCLVDDKGLVDVDPQDVEQVWINPFRESNLLSLFDQFLTYYT